MERGDRLACPSHCPKSVYQLMNKCWSSKRRKRPKFTQIISCLKEILNDFSSPEVNKDS
ncbi:unnamed protein product [Trichobilharzia regenti]|nr:unnamed protein product [Trichobilharzia regenti]